MHCYCTICKKTAGGGGYAINLNGDYSTLKIEGKENITIYNAYLNDPDEKENKKSPAIEQRLSTQPEKYGKPLRKSLKGYWKLRVGDIRIVFKIKSKEVLVLAILNRKDIYEQINKRIEE